jgi:hypothetical protein
MTRLTCIVASRKDSTVLTGNLARFEYCRWWLQFSSAVVEGLDNIPQYNPYGMLGDSIATGSVHYCIIMTRMTLMLYTFAASVELALWFLYALLPIRDSLLLSVHESLTTHPMMGLDQLWQE